MSESFVKSHEEIIDSVVLDTRPALQPEDIALDHISMRAALIERGEIPGFHDPRVKEILVNAELVKHMSHQIVMFLREYDRAQTLERQQFNSFGYEYKEIAENISLEVEELQKSLALLLVNSSHDMLILKGSEESKAEKSEKLKTLRENLCEVDAKKTNLQIDIAKLHDQCAIRSISQVEIVDEIRSLIIDTVDDTDSDRELSAYISVVSDNDEPYEVKLSTLLSDEERTKAAQECPALLKKYRETLAAAETENRDLAATINQNGTFVDQISAINDEIEKTTAEYNYFSNEYNEAAERYASYGKIIELFNSRLKILNANTSLYADYFSGTKLIGELKGESANAHTELAERSIYPAVKPIKTTRMISQSTTLSDANVPKFAAKYYDQLKIDVVPSNAVENQYLEDVKGIFKVLERYKQTFTKFAEDIKQDTDAKSSEVYQAYLVDATSLERFIAQINGEQGVAKYLFELALYYDRSSELQKNAEHNKVVQEQNLEDTETQLINCGRRLRAVNESIKIHKEDIRAVEDEIQKAHTDYEESIVQCAKEKSDRFFNLKTTTTEDDINAYYTEFEHGLLQPSDAELPVRRVEVEEYIKRLQPILNGHYQELAAAEGLKNELSLEHSNLIDKKLQIIKAISDLNDNIHTYSEELKAAMNDGSYKNALAIRDAGMHIFSRIKNKFEESHPQYAQFEQTYTQASINLDGMFAETNENRQESILIPSENQDVIPEIKKRKLGKIKFFGRKDNIAAGVMEAGAEA